MVFPALFGLGTALFGGGGVAGTVEAGIASTAAANAAAKAQTANAESGKRIMAMLPALGEKQNQSAALALHTSVVANVYKTVLGAQALNMDAKLTAAKNWLSEVQKSNG